VACGVVLIPANFVNAIIISKLYKESLLLQYGFICSSLCFLAAKILNWQYYVSMHFKTVPLHLVLASVRPAMTKTCVMPHTNGGDDSSGILATAASCFNDLTIVFSEGISW